MSEPLVSIIIPCYNAAEWLAETLCSAQAQTWTRKEILIIDDGSTDQSLAVAKRFERSGLKIFSQRNAGQSSAFNHGLREAQGDYCEFLDADDLLHPEKIARQIDVLRRVGPSWIASGAWARFENTIAEARFQEEPVWRDLDPVSWLTTSWSGGGMMHGAAWLVPRHLVDRAGHWGADLSLVNDFDFFCRVLLQSEGVRFCPEALSYYRSGLHSSLSAQKSEKAWLSAYQSFTRGTAHLLAHENSARTRAAAARTFQSFAYAAYPTVPDLVSQAEQRVRELGGSDHKLRSGRLFNALAGFAGWKFARRMQVYSSQLRRQ